MRSLALVAALLTVTLAACAGEPSTAPVSATTAVPFTMQPTVTAIGGGTGYPGVDHITVDETGGYLCVLRRGDDLAALRGRFIERRPGR